MTMLHIVVPISFIYVTIHTYKSAVSMVFVVFPESIVSWSICPFINSASIFICSNPFTFIKTIFFIFLHGFHNSIDIMINVLLFPIKLMQFTDYFQHCLMIIILIKYFTLLIFEVVDHVNLLNHTFRYNWLLCAWLRVFSLISLTLPTHV